MSEQDARYMARAIQLARRGKGQTSPNPVVGAVLVKGGRIVAEGWHRRCGADHAEVVALKKAGRSARGARLYVTLEPCFHYGRTPPCVAQIIESGVKEVVIAMKDPNPLTNGKSVAKLRRSGIKVTVGILQGEAQCLNEAFVKYIRTRMPFVAAKCAQSLDGKIATAAGNSQWITSAKTRAYARRLRNEFDAICAGINTVRRDNPRLSGASGARRLKKIILDSSLRTPLKAKLFAGVSPQDCIIAVTRKAPQGRIRTFEKKGVGVIICPQREGHIDLAWLFKTLAKKGITSILMEGGAHVVGAALKEKLVDKLYIYVAPKIIGDQNALSAVVGVNTVRVNKSIQLKNITFQKIDKDFLITGYV